MTLVAPLPAGIVAEGENEDVAPAGTPDTVNVTGFAVVAFEGVSIRLNVAELPATTEAVGVAIVTLKSSTTIASAEVVPPPGSGFFTAMFRMPLWAKSPAGNAAVSDAGFENVVGRGLPPTRTVELELKFVPVTASVSAALPAATVLVERSLAPGTGLFTVKVVTREGLPPGLATITKGVPATAIALAG